MHIRAGCLSLLRPSAAPHHYRRARSRMFCCARSIARSSSRSSCSVGRRSLASLRRWRLLSPLLSPPLPLLSSSLCLRSAAERRSSDRLRSRWCPWPRGSAFFAAAAAFSIFSASARLFCACAFFARIRSRSEPTWACPVSHDDGSEAAAASALPNDAGAPGAAPGTPSRCPCGIRGGCSGPGRNPGGPERGPHGPGGW